MKQQICICAMDLFSELQTAKRVAKEAGALLMVNFGKKQEVKTKENGTKYTDADLLSAKHISQSLTAAYPQYAQLNEEAIDDSRFDTSKKYCWVIDPLDGSTSYIAGKETFCVLIGLMYKFKPVLGVCYKPATDELFFAIKGKGAFLTKEERTEKLSVRNDKSLSFIVSPKEQAGKSDIEELFPKAPVEAYGSLLKMIGVAQGHATVFYVKNRWVFHLWDLCAPQVILQEAGGKVTDALGKKLCYDTKDVVHHTGILATNKKVHRLMLKTLKTFDEKNQE